MSTCSSDGTVITVIISVFVAVESSIHTSFVTRAIKIIAVHVGRYRISVSPCTSGNDCKTKQKFFLNNFGINNRVCSLCPLVHYLKYPSPHQE